MIEFVLICLGFLLLLAVVVPIADAVCARPYRMVAADRRARWEERRLARRARHGYSHR